MIEFTIPGTPFAKQRARMTKTGRMYTPAETVAYEAKVRAIAREYFPEPLAGPVFVSIYAYFEPPASWSKAKRAAAMGQYHTQKPDNDNIRKIILDALNGVAFADDSQVARDSGAKWWSLGGSETVVCVSSLA